MATTSDREAGPAPSYGTSTSEPSPGRPAGREPLAAEGNGGPPGRQRPLTRQERRQVRRGRRDERARERRNRRERAAATIWLPALGVAIRDGNVYAWELSWTGPATGRLLGPLAWAHAAATDGMASPGGLRAGISRKGRRGVAAVAFADGNVWNKKLIDASAQIKAKAETVRFNILAVGAAADTRAAGNGVASDLERLAALHASGSLDDEEFRQAKACALSGGN
jgi:hypothetical protein